MKPTSARFGPARSAALLGALLAACAPAGPPPPTVPGEPPPREQPPARTVTTVRLGVVLPQGGSGYLQQYADAVLEGVRVAAAQREAEGEQRIELTLRAASTPAQAAAAVRELTSLGVVGIVGPLLPETVSGAAAARTDTSVVIVSPTAAEAFVRLPNVYALNVPDTLGASVLGDYAGRSAAAPVAVLRPRLGAQEQARAFVGGYTRAAGRAPAEVTYEAGATTYAATLRRLRDSRVRTVFIAAEESDLRQLLPQVDYYGLAGVQLLASGPWATPDGLQRIGLRSLENVITALPFLEGDSTGTWQQFVRGYEALYRRSLDNAIPALGYDAAALLLAGALARPSAERVAERLRSGAEVTGATGYLVPMRGSVGRRPLLVRIQGERLVPVAQSR